MLFSRWVSTFYSVVITFWLDYKLSCYRGTHSYHWAWE